MRISVIVCTYNRAETLRKALESVAAQTLPGLLEREVVVVDNNSRDHTREVVQDFCSRYPRQFRYVFEPNQGLNHARNSGVQEARGEVLAFMDDDVTVEPGWLDNLTAPLRIGKWAGSGGKTLPPGTFTPPRWLAPDGPYNMLGVLCAYFNLGDKACELEEPPYGANMAFRKPMFEKYGAFRTDLDRCGANTMSNGDTEFGRRLLQAGEHLRYEPLAVVRHPVPQGRVTKEYFLAWWFDYGRAVVREWQRKPAVFGIPRPYFNILKLATVVLPKKIVRWALSPDPPQRFYNKCRVWLTAGQINEYYHVARRTQKQATHSISETRAS
jgi:glycosyltransferase involved in cell wall biosynthesis